MENSKNYRGKILIFLLAICLGGVTLGAGLGIGYSVMQHLLPESSSAEIHSGEMHTVRIDPLVIPINPQDPSFVDVIPLVKDAVVSISVTAEPRRPFGAPGTPGAGSGFIFAETDDYVFIATNYHVIEDAAIIRISLDDNEEVHARVVGTDPNTDLAVIASSKADLAGKGIPFTIAKLGDSDVLRMGDPVVAIGNAMGEGQTVTMGIVSALNLQITIDNPNNRRRLNLDVLQTDAAVNRGNSGGPLINQHGEVIGIVTAKLFGTNIEGMGYALPISDIEELLWELKELGSVRPPFIGFGANYQEVSEGLARIFNLPSAGIVLQEIVPESPAYYAGIEANDFLVSFDGESVSSFSEFRTLLMRRRPGDSVVLGIYRQGERLNITVELGAFPN